MDSIYNSSIENIKSITHLYRYHADTHQETETLYDIEFWLKTSQVLEEVKNIHSYVHNTITQYYDILNTDDELEELKNIYYANIKQYLSNVLFPYESVENAFKNFAFEWNQRTITTKNSYMVKHEININIFSRSTNTENMCILLGQPLEGKTHILIHFAKKHIEENLIHITFANFFEEKSLRENIILNLQDHELYSWSSFLEYLNIIGKQKNTYSVIIVDGLNEMPNFNVKEVFRELLEIRSDLNNYKYIKMITSIRSEFLNEENFHNICLFDIKSATNEAIMELCKSLNILKYYNPLLEHRNQPLGFYYIIAKVLESMNNDEKKKISNFTKQDIFLKRWKQIKTKFGKEKKGYLAQQTFEKLLSAIIKEKQLGISLDFFNEQEKGILTKFQEENLIVLYNDKVQFSLQNYSDYYIVDYIDKHWCRSIKKNIKAFINIIFYFFFKLVTFDFISSILVDLGMNQLQIFARSNSFIFKSNSWVLGKKNIFILKMFSLTTEQVRILIDNLREKYDYEFPFKVIQKNLKLKTAWISSIKTSNYELVKKNTKLIDLIKGMCLKDQIQTVFPHNLFIINRDLVELSMKDRDYDYIKRFEEFDFELIKLLKNMLSKSYRNIFNSYTCDKKKNELYPIIWSLCSRNRIVRDTATSILIFLLNCNEELYFAIWNDYKTVDDKYLVERLYLVGYALLINGIKRESLARELYTFAYPENDLAYPHTIIQEYGLRIYIWLLSHSIWQEPHHLTKHDFDLSFVKLLNNDITNIEEYIGFSAENSIKLELEGWYGDWGRYQFQSSVDSFICGIGNQELNIKEEIENFSNVLNKLINTNPKHRKCIELLIDNINKEYNRNLYNRGYSYNPLFTKVTLDKMITEALSSDRKTYAFALLGKQYILHKMITEYVTKKELNEDFDSYDNHADYHKSGRAVTAYERFTKKVQWIGMYEYLGHLRNHFNHVPYLATLEGLLYYYNFDNDIKLKIIEKLNFSKICLNFISKKNHTYNMFYTERAQLQLSIPLDFDENKNITYFQCSEEIISEIKKVTNQENLFALYNNKEILKQDIITKNEQEYIKTTFTNNGYVLIYGMENFSNENSIFFGTRGVLKDIVDFPSSHRGFNNSTVEYEYNECFLSTNDESADLVWNCVERNEYDFSSMYEDTVRDMFNCNLVKEFGLVRKGNNYLYDGKDVVKKKHRLWLMSIDFLDVLVKKGYSFSWYCYYEKKESGKFMAWDIDVTYTGNFDFNYTKRR